MADGHIKISIEVDGKEIEVASKDLDNLGRAGQDSGKGLKLTESSMDSLSDSSSKAGKSVEGTGKSIDGVSDSSIDAAKGVKGTSDSLDDMSGSASKAADSTKGVKDETRGVGQESNKASGNIRKIATSLGLVAIGAAAFKTLRASMDDAISRFDTLNKFPKVMEALGVSAEDSERAINKLSDGTDGLPTKLDDIAASAQEMYMTFNDVDKATDTALALNNALLASGANAEQAKRGTQQYTKALQTGQFDLITWRSLSETMSVGLSKVAEEFGYAGDSAKQDLYKALQDGTVPIGEFNDKLIELGTGTGELAKLAKVNSQGIANSLGNLRYAAARGIANIIESFDELSEAVTGKSLAQNIDSLKHVVMAAFGMVQRVIEGTIPVFIVLATVISSVYNVAKMLSPVLIGMATAFAMHTVIHQTTNAIKAFQAATILANAQAKISATTTAVMTVARKAMTVVTTAATVAELLLTGQITLATAAKLAAAGAAGILRGALQLMLGPVGWVTAGIGALVGGVVAVVKWFKRSSDEAKKLNEDTEELGKSTNELSDAVESGSDAYKDNQRSIEASSKANEELASKVQELADKENKSAAEKAILKSYTDQLNESVEGLSLTYDDEADALNMSSEQIQARIDLMEEQTSYNDALERQMEISKEQTEVEMQRKETNKLKEEWNQKLEEGSVKTHEHQEAIAKLDEQEQELTETHKILGDEFEEVELQVTESMESMIEMVESGAISQSEMVAIWVENNQELVESMRDSYQEIYEITTDAFERINDESKLSAEEMLDNLKHNQEMMAEWGDNISELMGFASENGHENFLHWLETLGPDSAAEVAVISEMSDKELEEFANTMEEGADVSTEVFGQVLGEGMEESAEILGDHITGLSDTMQSAARDANFEKVGEDIVEGYIEGIAGGTPDAADAGGDMIEATEDAARKQAETGSPSKAFMRVGVDITEGLVLGINSGTSEVIKTAKELLQSVIDPFDNTSSDFESIGGDAMSGLNQGLLAGKAQVMATARSIANQVASTMQSALRIHSPSRVMRDDVGFEISGGVAEGILKGRDSIHRALNSVNNMIISTPEIALGTAQMSYAGAMGSQSNYNSISHDNRKSFTPHVVNHFTPEESTPSESARKQKQQLQRLAMEWR